MAVLTIACRCLSPKHCNRLSNNLRNCLSWKSVYVTWYRFHQFKLLQLRHAMPLLHELNHPYISRISNASRMAASPSQELLAMCHSLRRVCFAEHTLSILLTDNYHSLSPPLSFMHRTSCIITILTATLYHVWLSGLISGEIYTERLRYFHEIDASHFRKFDEVYSFKMLHSFKATTIMTLHIILLLNIFELE